MFAFGQSRAQMIGVTEVTRAYFEGNQAAARATEAEGLVKWRKTWQTNKDNLVCSLCSPLDSKSVVGTDKEFPDGAGQGPPRHPRCRCWVTYDAVIGEMAEAEARREEEAGLRDIRGSAPTGADITTRPLDKWMTRGLSEENWADATHDSRYQVKTEIVDALVRQTGLSPDDVSKFVHQWAESSNDNDMRSLAIQKAASELFDIPLSDFTQDKLNLVEKLLETTSFPNDEKFHALLPASQQKAFLQAMYDNTQEAMAQAGFEPGDTIRLRRGVALPKDIAADWEIRDIITVEGNALESWSLGEDTANWFAKRAVQGSGYRDAGFVIEMDVPIKALVGSARSGFGCLTEGEFVIKGSLSGQARILSKIGGY